MNAKTHLGPRAVAFTLGLAAVAACSDPFKPPMTTGGGGGPLEDCAASTEWLYDSNGQAVPTPPVEMFTPLAHPTTECPFYRGGWQNFLIAMQPDAQGRPALLSFPTIEKVFTPKVPYSSSRSFLGDIKQAGRREIVVDQNGNPLYYGIHVNTAFADFIHANHLETAAAIQAYPTAQPNLFFPAGVTEFKSAWQVVEGTAQQIADQTAGFISMVTTVPTLHAAVDGNGINHITEDRDTPRMVTVRLLAIHVVFTLPGHPEFIWASFEHSLGAPDASAADGKRDVAPTFAGMNPSDMDANNSKITTPVDAEHTFLLYKTGTAANEGNVSISENDLHLDEMKQKFLNPADGSPQQTSIYRMFPASKSNTTDPDDAVTSLNNNVEHLFEAAQANSSLAANDKRGNYRLVGGQWMDKPKYFKNDFPVQNDLTSPFAQDPGSQADIAGGSVGVGPTKFTDAIIADGSDSPYSILAGEDRMSSTAMESFTQAPGGFNNCFTCHNTQAITALGTPLNRDKAAVQLLKPGLLNVSHILSQFVLEECGSTTMPGNDQGSAGSHAVCPP
jgi:hypothetical protein